MDQAHLKNVAGTAFIIAEFRSWEALQVERLYTDDVLPHLLDAHSRAAAERAASVFPVAPEMVQIRTRWFDDRIADSVDRGSEQLVLLGSGLDTRGAAPLAREVDIYEIDRSEILDWKRDRLAGARVPLRSRLVAADYVTEDVIGLLEQAGLDPGRPTHLHWEGNSVYVARAAFFDVLRRFVAAFDTLTVTLDYMTPVVIRGETGHGDLDAYIAQLAERRAPWVTGFEDADEIARPVGLQVCVDRPVSRIRDYFRNDHNRRFALLDYYRLAELETPRDDG